MDGPLFLEDPLRLLDTRVFRGLGFSHSSTKI